MIETSRFPQMHLNLNFSRFSPKLRNLTISSETNFPHVPSVLSQFCKPCLECKHLRAAPVEVLIALYFVHAVETAEIKRSY